MMVFKTRFKLFCSMLLALSFAGNLAYAEEAQAEKNSKDMTTQNQTPSVFGRLDFSLSDGEFNAFRAPVNFDLKLSKLLGDSKPRNLNGIDARMTVPLPLPAMWEAEEVTLELDGVASKGLIKTSQLVVIVNDRIIGQKELGTGDDKFNHRINIPVEFLTDGFNSVQVRAIQHYAEVCETPLSPQLWTQINLEQSKFVIRAHPRTANASLNLLPKLFDRATWQETPTIPVFTANNISDTQMGALSYVAQGIGQRYSFVPVRLLKMNIPANLQEFDNLMPKRSRSAVVLATFDAIKPLLGAMDFPTNQGPVIAVQALPNNKSRYIVFLLGKDDKEVNQAASAFAIPGVPWPDNAWTAIRKIDIPVQEKLEKRFSLPTAGTGAFPLRALGYKSQTVRGMDGENIKLKIWNNTWQGRMQVRIHLSYASGMSNQSALNVVANGVMHGSIPLNNPDGGVYENYAVTVPAGALKPGWNDLEFQPVMIPANNGGECQPFFNGNLALTIYEDTTIQKFGGDELKQVDLATISGAGYIFTEKPLGRGIAFHLASKDADTISAAMTLVAKLSQVYNRPLLNSSFAFSNKADTSGDYHFWVGAYKNLPEQLQSQLSVSIPSSLNIAVPLIQSATVQVYEGAEWLTNILEKLNIRSTAPQNFTEVKMDLSGEFSANSFALSTENDDGEPTIIFTASSTSALREGVDTIVDYGQWSQLRGLFSFWLPDSKEVYAISSDNAPFSAYGLRGGLGLWVSQYPWASLFILLSFIGILVLFSRRVMKQYKRRHHQDEN
jgi:hypothetical protein